MIKKAYLFWRRRAWIIHPYGWDQVDKQLEKAYRAGYHQAMKDIAKQTEA